MRRAKKIAHNTWVPEPGRFASYDGKYSSLLKAGKLVRVVAEASNKRTLVEALGHKGKPVKFTVLSSNLERPQPLLFE